VVEQADILCREGGILEPPHPKTMIAATTRAVPEPDGAFRARVPKRDTPAEAEKLHSFAVLENCRVTRAHAVVVSNDICRALFNRLRRYRRGIGLEDSAIHRASG
jgi:hypothetical protein